jgi:hypothetical protein
MQTRIQQYALLLFSQTNIRSFPSQNHNKINHNTTSRTNYNDDNNKDDGNMTTLLWLVYIKINRAAAVVVLVMTLLLLTRCKGYTTT